MTVWVLQYVYLHTMRITSTIRLSGSSRCHNDGSHRDWFISVHQGATILVGSHSNTPTTRITAKAPRPAACNGKILQQDCWICVGIVRAIINSRPRVCVDGLGVASMRGNDNDMSKCLLLGSCNACVYNGTKAMDAIFYPSEASLMSSSLYK